MALKDFEKEYKDFPIMKITDEMIEFAENMAKHPKEAKKVWSQAGSSMLIDWAKKIRSEYKYVTEADFLLYAEERREKEQLQDYFAEGIKIVQKQLADERKIIQKATADERKGN